MTASARDLGVTIPVARIGKRAHAQLMMASAWSVSAMFERCFYITDGAGNFVCIGDPSIGDGPLNAILTPHPAQTRFGPGLSVGERAERHGQLICFRTVAAIDFAHCLVWRPAPWPPVADASKFEAALRHVIKLAAIQAPADGLLSAVLPVRSPDASIARALLRSAALSIATLRDWLEDDSANCDDMNAFVQAAVHRLIGLGAGLTPSGDDLLAGLLISLHATEKRSRAARLAGFIASASLEATSDLSRAFLQCAIDGEPSGPLHAFLSAVLAADIPAMTPALQCLAQTGHTSGWDMLAGVIMGLAMSARNAQAE